MINRRHNDMLHARNLLVIGGAMLFAVGQLVCDVKSANAGSPSFALPELYQIRLDGQEGNAWYYRYVTDGRQHIIEPICPASEHEFVKLLKDQSEARQVRHLTLKRREAMGSAVIDTVSGSRFVYAYKANADGTPESCIGLIDKSILMRL